MKRIAVCFLLTVGAVSVYAQSWQDQNSLARDLSNWKEKRVVLSLFYTSCPTMCGMTVSSLKRIESALEKRFGSGQFDFVLFTIDPKRDTSRRLKEYAKKNGVDHWILLTGPVDETKRLLLDFDLGFSAKTGQEHIMHSTKIVLLDVGLNEVLRLDSISPDLSQLDSMKITR